MNVFLFIEAREIECAAIDDIRRRGLSPILFTSRYLNESHFYCGVDLQRFDGVYYVDTFDSAAMLDCIRHNGMPVSAVLGCYDDVMIPAAEVAHALQLPHPCLDGLRTAVDRGLTQAALAERGYALPPRLFFSIDSAPLLPAIPYPLAIMPVRHPWGQGTYICHTGEQYRQAIADIGLHDQHGGPGAEPRGYVMEHYIEGPRYSADLLFNTGSWRVVAINRRFMRAGDRPAITGIGQPSDLDPARSAVAASQVIAWVDALALRGGALSVAFIDTADGPVPTAVSLRISGARVASLVEMTTGINMMEHVVDFACGAERPLPAATPRYPFVAEAAIFYPGAGGIDESTINKNHPYFISCGVKTAPAHLKDHSRYIGTVIGHVTAYGDSCQEAMAHAEAIVRQTSQVLN